MFERYTDRARGTVFFARYEAIQFGSPVIDSEHLLLGLLREEKSLQKWIPKADGATACKRIENGNYVSLRGAPAVLTGSRSSRTGSGTAGPDTPRVGESAGCHPVARSRVPSSR